MGVGYRLVNTTKKEIIKYLNLPVEKKGEICSSHVASKITTLYLLENMGDNISFVPDQYNEKDWPLSETKSSDLDDYLEVTEVWLTKAESGGYISGRTKEIIDEDEPELFVWRFSPSEY